MKTRNILTMSLLLISILSLRPSQAHAAQQKAMPDLVIRNIQSIEDYKVVAVVSNFGSAASGVCVFTLDISDPNNPKHILKAMELAVPALEPGQFFIATFETAPQKAKGHRLQFWVDRSGRVRESDEYNNRKLDVSTVVKSPFATSGGFPKGSPADLIIKSIAGTPSKDQVTPLMPFRLTVDSKNVVEESQKANNKAFYAVPTNYKP